MKMERAEKGYEVSVAFRGLAGKKMIYYRNSLNAEKGGIFLDSFLENAEGKEQEQEAKEETPPETKQTKL